MNLKDLKAALWGLSNYVTGGRQIRDFVDSGHIFDRILKLVDCQEDFEIAREAAFVITNALTSCDNEIVR